MKKSFLYLLCSVAALTLSACSNVNQVVDHHLDEDYLDENGNLTEPIDIATNFNNEKPHDEYQEGVVLVKTFEEIDTSTLDLKVASIEELYPHSLWKKITLNEGTTYDAVQYLRKTNMFDKVDYDYMMDADGDVEVIDVSDNPLSEQQTYLETQGIRDAWGYEKTNGSEPGGSSNVVVAVIDTGVDYNHIDLRNNIWTNAGEIPNNGIDDDGNGYIDDVHGWDCVANDNDPMDDNGHGTHVAGIVAASNDNAGVVGVAFNCKIMCIKAGNSSGYFINSDIAEAIQYAYMNGASVINMSFGGSSITQVVKESLESAYNQCVLVAAAGNSSACNSYSCPCLNPHIAFFPAALPYVVGVMSSDVNGMNTSSFSNFDHILNDTNEYEVYACGEGIVSTFPNNKYAKLNGTSMAAPIISGLAALLRSHLTDRNTFSNKYIQSQIVNTGKAAGNMFYGHQLFANGYNAFAELPKPNAHLTDYYIFDSEDISSKNNNNGVIEAGETIRMAIEVHNKGGVAANVNASINATNSNGFDDPFISFTKETLTMQNIGTYSTANTGLIYENDKIVGSSSYFEFTLADNTPTSYLIDLNISMSYTNGMDDNDNSLYGSENVVTIRVVNGIELPSLITENTTFAGNRVYYINHDVTIASGVTVNFEAGSELIFYANSYAVYTYLTHSPSIVNYGTLNFNGEKGNEIYIHPADGFDDYACVISNANYTYCKVLNLGETFDKGYPALNEDSNSNAYYSSFERNGMRQIQCIFGGSVIGLVWNRVAFNNFVSSKFDSSYLPSPNSDSSSLSIRNAENSYFDASRGYYYPETGASCSSRCDITIDVAKDCIFVTYGAPYSNGPSYINISDAENNVFMTKDNSRTTLDCFTLQINDPCNTYLDFYNIAFDSLLDGFITSSGQPLFDINDTSKIDLDKVYPYVKSIQVFDSSGNETKICGASTYSIRVLFNTSMDTTKNVDVCYGTTEPYADQKVTGEFVDSYTWEGEFYISSTIDDGQNYFSVRNAYSVAGLKAVSLGTYYGFTIDTTAAMSMNLQANSSTDGIELTWVQDDYDTLMGYNIYRAESKDGNFAKINPSVIPAGENTFLDDSCEPGQTYWYTFTVVLSDFSESAPAGKVSATAIDTISPVIYHTPVNQGYEGNNLVINCTISDNIAVQSATLYYRTVGDENWKTIVMSKVNDRFSASIFGSDVTMDGLEYYISATDGRNVITRGSANNPFTVIVKDASLLNDLGDVDGDGMITTKDALMIVRALNGQLLLTDDQFRRADLNKDNSLSAAEALRILQYINGNVNTLEIPAQ